jgi:hypothetical protein
MITKYSLPYTNLRPDRHISQLSIGEIPLSEDFARDRTQDSLVVMQPGGWGGRHIHPRQEAFIGFGEGMYLVWLDEQGKRCEEKMDQGGETVLVFVVSSLTQHLVENRSRTEPGILFEMADGAQVDVLPAPDLS